VSFSVLKGQTLGLVGESGCGKSTVGRSVLGLIPASSGSVKFKGQELVGMGSRDLRAVRRRAQMVFQDPMTCLNPTLTIGLQITETIRRHLDLDRKAAHKRAVELLEEVRIPNAAKRLDDYPHRYSGGMRQRVMIAIALSCNPRLLIADEPTTALDVTIQAQVMEVLRRIQERTKSAIVLITHDLGVVAGFADKVMVMYAGRQVETGTVDDIYYRPSHPYTQGLLKSLPRMDIRVADERLYRIKGQPPSLITLPPGCSFNPRCEFALPGVCDVGRPELVEVGTNHLASCYRTEVAVEAWSEHVS
jgi:oligopeptide/dipeptide ABC transporter ATP-binding protein